jgi:hypothetical protein
VIVPGRALLGLMGWVGGLFLYRWPKWRVLAFVLWGSSAVSSLSFLVGILFIVTTPV